MRLTELLRPEHVVVPLQAETATAAAWTLVDRLVKTGAVTEPAKLLARVDEERSEDIVGMGDRAFLMHYRTDAVADLVVAMGVSPEPIRRDLGSAESQTARIALVVVASPRRAARYLQVLNVLARLLARPEVLEAILAARAAEDVLSHPVVAEIEIPEHLAVRDVMTERPRRTSPDALLRDAAADMVRAGVGAMPVVDEEGLLVGMLTEKELLRHLLANSLQSGAVSGVGPAYRATPQPGTITAGGEVRKRVRDVMTRQVLCVSPEQPLADVASLMVNKDVDRIPVVHEGRLAGFLTRGDIIRKLVEP